MMWGPIRYARPRLTRVTFQITCKGHAWVTRTKGMRNFGPLAPRQRSGPREFPARDSRREPGASAGRPRESLLSEDEPEAGLA